MIVLRFLLVEVEQQHFRAASVGECHFARTGQLQRIPGFKQLAVHFHAAARDVHVAEAAGCERMTCLFRLFEQAGAQVSLMQPFMTQAMLDGMDHFWRMRSHVDLGALPPQRKARVLPYIQAWADSAAGMSGEAVFHAGHQFYLTRLATVKACAAFDYVISPTSPNLPAPAEWAGPTNDPLRPLEHIAFTVPFNMSEQPAASVNCGYSTGGLPIGLQIAGARFDDLGVLQVSRAFELIRDAQRPWPEPPAR